jgi:hypothetical protein
LVIGPAGLAVGPAADPRAVTCGANGEADPKGDAEPNGDCFGANGESGSEPDPFDEDPLAADATGAPVVPWPVGANGAGEAAGVPWLVGANGAAGEAWAAAANGAA